MSSPKDIMFVLPTLGGGGAEKVLLSLATAFLDSTSFRPVLVVTSKCQTGFERPVPDSLPVIRIGAKRVVTALPALLRLIRRMKPAIIFASVDHLCGALGLAAPLIPKRTRLILRATSLNSLEHPMLRRILTWAYRRADTIIFQSQAMQQVFVQRLGLPRGMQMVVMANPIDFDVSVVGRTEPSWPVGTKTRLLAAGRLHPVKGFDLLISAMTELPETVSLVILGEGNHRPLLQAQISELGLSHRVTLAGFQQAPAAWFAAADAFVLSSRGEGYPNVVIEALANECPVIATPLPGLDATKGCALAKDISPEALADAIRQFILAPHRADPQHIRDKHDIALIRQGYEALFNGTEPPCA